MIFASSWIIFETTLHQGATLLLSARLKFLKTARFEGKLFVKGSGSLEGCFWFREDAFIQSSAEMHFADCHNVKKGATGGAIHMRGNLIVTGTLSIHNCSAAYGGSLAFGWRIGFGVSSCLRCLFSRGSSAFGAFLWHIVTILKVPAFSTWWQWGPCFPWNPEAKANKFSCFIRMLLLLPVMTQDSRQFYYVWLLLLIVPGIWRQPWSPRVMLLFSWMTCCRYLPRKKGWTGIVILATVAEILAMKCGLYIFPIFPVQRSLSCNLATEFCLYAAGGIYVLQTFTNSGRNLKISRSSAKVSGGAVLRSFSGIGLAWSSYG